MKVEGIYNTDTDTYGEVLVNGLPLHPERSQMVWNHSPDGFAWGYLGSGPAQLALAILLASGIDPHDAVRLHERFKVAFIGTLPVRGDFVFEVDIAAWVANAPTVR